MEPLLLKGTSIKTGVLLCSPNENSFYKGALNLFL